MFLYKGVNPDGNNKKEMQFEDENEAIDYARENAYPYRKYQVTNLSDNEVVDSDEMSQNEEDAIIDDMCPEGQDE